MSDRESVLRVSRGAGMSTLLARQLLGDPAGVGFVVEDAHGVPEDLLNGTGLNRAQRRALERFAKKRSR